MPVPLLDVRRQNAPLAGELCAAAARVIASGTYILGPEVERFEAAAASVAGAEFAVGLSSGTDALLVALLALGIGPGDEVICPCFTFFATAGSIARTGARPVFADSLPDSFNLDAAAVEALITPRTRAIIPVHLFGQAADLDAILEIAARHGLRVIEDAAQSFGAEYGGRKVGALGDCGTVSFYPSKNLGGFGEAGLLVTNDSGIAARARLVRNHGAERQYFHSTVGGNFRLDALKAHLDGRGIGTAIYYPLPLHRQECFRDYGPYPALPVADRLAAESLSLPVFPEMTEAEQDEVAQAIREFFSGPGR